MPVVAGWYDDLLSGTMARVSYTGEGMDHERLLLWPSGRISERGRARSHWWVRSPDGDVCKEDMNGTDPGIGPSGSSRLQDAAVGDGRRQYGFRALPTNRELLDRRSEAREFARALRGGPTNVDLPGRLTQPYRLSFPLDHLHVTEKQKEPWLLAEHLVGLDIGIHMELAVQDVVARGHVGLINVGRTWMRAGRVPEAERKINWTRDHILARESSRKPLVRHTQLLQDPTMAQG